MPMTPTAAFDLRAVVADVLASSGEADPHALVPIVVDRIPDEELRNVVCLLLPWMIREEIRRVRSTNGNGKAPTSGRWEGVQEASNDPLVWREYAKRQWRFLADCTVEDVRAMAEAYHGRAAANSLMAKRYERLAEEMEQTGATVVGDLPAEIVRAVLTS